MPNKEADKRDSKSERERAEEETESPEENSDDEDRKSEKKKLPEPPGNLNRRAEWFKKRH